MKWLISYTAANGERCMIPTAYEGMDPHHWLTAMVDNGNMLDCWGFAIVRIDP